MEGVLSVFAEVGGALAASLVSYGVSFGLSIALYVLESMGLYTMADKRGIKHPWLAWIPVVQLWILGSIADQYRYVTKGKVCNSRKSLIGLRIASSVLWIVVSCVWIGFFINLVMDAGKLDGMHENQVLQQVLPQIFSCLGVTVLAGIPELVLKVFRYIAYYNLFASSMPDNKVLFTVLSVVIPVTVPFFVFACRNREEGMPPRRPVAQPVTEPWDQPTKE